MTAIVWFTRDLRGCVIGVDYPEPIVDHREARQEAFARYRVQ